MSDMDVYARQVAYLKRVLEVQGQRDYDREVQFHWEQSSPLFAFISADGKGLFRLQDGQQVGCPTMIRSGKYAAETPELTEFIRKEESIPLVDYIWVPVSLEVLERFAYIQRLADVQLERTPAEDFPRTYKDLK